MGVNAKNAQNAAAPSGPTKEQAEFSQKMGNQAKSFGDEMNAKYGRGGQ